MQIQFNYRYLKDEIEHETHQYNFTNSIEQRLAYQLQDVGDVVNFAETKQKWGIMSHYIYHMKRQAILIQKWQPSQFLNVTFMLRPMF